MSLQVNLQVALPIGCVVDWRPDRRTRLAWVAVALGCPVAAGPLLKIIWGFPYLKGCYLGPILHFEYTK